MNFERVGQIGGRRALMLLGAFIVTAGIAVGLISGLSGVFPGLYGSFGPAGSNGVKAPGYFGQGYSVSSTYTSIATSASTTVSMSSTTTENPYPPGSGVNYTAGKTSGLLEFSSDLSIESNDPLGTANQVVGFAYEFGGYVAFQSTTQNSASVVIRVPASAYQEALKKVESLGTVDSLTSNSNDVTVQYSDLNATLQSLRTEQSDLLRFLNQSSNITTTLNIESQLQGVNAQINSIESQILQTKTLVDYSTINVAISEPPAPAVKATPLSMVLKAEPENGTAPFSVTVDAIVSGGAQPYLVNWNFGDGTGDQGQILIHTYVQAGDFKITATLTDGNGSVIIKTARVHVDSPPGQGGIAGFVGTVSGLFVNVVEGIVEVAAVVLPLAAVGAVVWLPFRRRIAQKGPKQS